MSNDDLYKVRKFTKQRVDKDGYIVEEEWYGKNTRCDGWKEEQGFHEIESKEGKKYPIYSKLEKEYAGQEAKDYGEQERLKKELERRANFFKKE